MYVYQWIYCIDQGKQDLGYPCCCHGAIPKRWVSVQHSTLSWRRKGTKQQRTRALCNTAFGPTVQELDVSDAVVNRDKTKFSMYIPEVANALKERNTKSVILVGIEVS